MLIRNTLAAHGSPLEASDRTMLGRDGAAQAGRFLKDRDGYQPTPLVSLPRLAEKLGVAAVSIKDESCRLGLGSFKALGGAYAVVRLAVEAASERENRPIDVSDWRSQAVAAAAARMTFACATDGNHGRSVAQGAQLIGAQCVVFVHAGVREARAEAIARYGARIVRVEGGYDNSVAEAARVAGEEGWIVVSDTSWPGYERTPLLVMQGYAAMLREAVEAMAAPPTHVFIQAGVGGVAASVAAYFAEAYGPDRPWVTVVEPSQAACLLECARVGRLAKAAHGGPTIMAMLDCYEPSMVAWRILSRAADAFMTVEDEDAVGAMRRLAYPLGDDLAIVAGESGGVGLAALMVVAGDATLREAIGLGQDARVFLINTEGATDPALYQSLVGASPAGIAGRAPNRMSAEV